MSIAAAGAGDDPVDGGEAEAGAFAFALGGEERLEGPLDRLLVHADAGVAHFQADVAARLGVGVHVGVLLVEVGLVDLDHQAPAVRHRVASVDGQVDQHLLDLAGIGLDRTAVLAEAGDQLDPLPQRPAQEVLQLGDDVAQIQQLRLDDLAAAEDQQLAGQRRGALGGAADFLHVLVAPASRPPARRRRTPRSS